MRSMSAHHYDDLASVYVGNIKRLTFVADAQSVIEDIEAPATCPYCESPLEEHQEADYLQGAQAEAEAIAEDLEELATVRKSLNEYMSTLQQRIEILHDKQRGIERELAQAVLPQIAKLRDQIMSLTGKTPGSTHRVSNT
ncbi:hypothetical protein [Trueperella pyogenes]|uniref:hypothetical protein n=1 Tax=Trueperella pyogenes TaxID=1661 RepID=UPI00215CA40B|nr:hypothetical protein [Trueperella pyogenes]UVJ59040.1 hypothetical protein M5C92_06570 [Trueperella pyogenes]